MSIAYPAVKCASSVRVGEGCRRARVSNFCVSSAASSTERWLIAKFQIQKSSESSDVGSSVVEQMLRSFWYSASTT